MKFLKVLLIILLLVGVGLGSTYFWAVNKKVFFVAQGSGAYWLLPEDEKEAFRQFVIKTQGKDIFVFSLEKGVKKTPYSMGIWSKEPVVYAETLKYAFLRVVKIYIVDEEWSKYKTSDRNGMVVNLLLLQLKQNHNYADQDQAEYTKHFYLSDWNMGVVKK